MQECGNIFSQCWLNVYILSISELWLSLCYGRCIVSQISSNKSTLFSLKNRKITLFSVFLPPKLTNLHCLCVLNLYQINFIATFSSSLATCLSDNS